MNIYEIFGYYFLSTFLIISLVVFVHEMGHFLAARWCGIPVKVFSVGFGREIFGHTDKYGTHWKLCLFPLGGYISTDESDKTPLRNRAFVTLSGPMMNILFSAVLMLFVLCIWGIPRAPLEVVGLVKGVGADRAGVMIGDVLVAIDGEKLPTDPEIISEKIKKAPHDFVEVEILREGKILSKKINITHMMDEDEFGAQYSRKRLGVLLAGSNISIKSINVVAGVDVGRRSDAARQELLQNMDKEIILNYGEGVFAEDVRIKPLSVLNADLLERGSLNYKTLVTWDSKKRFYEAVPFVKAVTDTADLIGRSFKVFVGIIYQMVTGKKKTGDIGGVIQMGEMAGNVTSQTIEDGPSTLLRMIVILSIQIGLLNLLPLPVLDGGYLMFYAYEAITKKPASLKFKGYMYGFGIVFLIWVILIANLSDVLRFLTDR